MFGDSVNIAVCGHTDAGKSTLLGHLLVLLGRVPESALERATSLAKAIARDKGQMYAFLVYTQKGDEYVRGKTILPARVRFEMGNRMITIIDTPGMKDYIKNMIWGLHQADYAVLLVDAVKGLHPGTSDVLSVLRSFQTPIIAVVINKMDDCSPAWSEQTFRKMSELAFLAIEEAGLEHTAEIPCIPTSAKTGEGLISYQKIKWHSGPSFYEFMQGLSISKPLQSGPMRLSFNRNDVFEVKGLGQVVVGVVESGELHVGSKLLFEPLSSMRKEDVVSKVRSIQLAKGVIDSAGRNLAEGVPRQVVGVLLSRRRGEGWKSLFRREAAKAIIASELPDTPTVGRLFRSYVTLIKGPSERSNLLSEGHAFMINAHGDQVQARLVRILRTRKEGQNWVSGGGPGISPSDQAEAEILTSRKIALEENGKIPSLSRFTIRTEIGVVGYGSCSKMMEETPWDSLLEED